MALFPWDDKYKINHMVIDADHKKLVDLINQLADAMQAGKGRDVCGKVLNELVSYTKTHFATEEKLMAAHAYARMAEHKAEHAKFVKEVLDFKGKFDSGALTVTASLLTFLRDWLIHHIMNSDKALVQVIGNK